MTNPYETDESPLECGGCAEPHHVIELVNGTPTPLCRDCFEDSTFICVDCSDRFWSCDAVPVYDKFDRCKRCAQHKEDCFRKSWQQRQDEYKDTFQQERR